MKPVRPPGSTRIDQIPEDFEMRGCNASSHLHCCPLDDHASVNTFPQRYEQLAGERDNRRLSETAAIALDPVYEP